MLRVHELKSAVYTVASPLTYRRHLGGGPPGLLRATSTPIGIDLGIAFQFRDDVLGAGFDSRAPGKSANDLVEGKRTFLVVRAWAQADAAGRDALDVGPRRPVMPPPPRCERARDVIRSTGSLAYSEKRIAALAQRAYDRIDKTRQLRPAGRALMREIGDRLVHRST